MAERDPVQDPAQGDEVYLGVAGGPVRVLGVDEAGVSWLGLPGSSAVGQRRATPHNPLDALPSRQRPAARAVLDACEQLADPDRRVRCPEALRLERSGLKRSSWQRGETALVGLGLLVVESAGAHRSCGRVLLLQPAREASINGPRGAETCAFAGGFRESRRPGDRWDALEDARRAARA